MSVDFTNDTYSCSADCNPKCKYVWVDAYSSQLLTNGSSYSTFRTDQVAEVLCIARNNYGVINMSCSTGISTGTYMYENVSTQNGTLFLVFDYIISVGYFRLELQFYCPGKVIYPCLYYYPHVYNDMD